MGKHPFRVLVIAGALLAYTSAADAAGLGKLTVLSELGRPLRAEIDVVALEKVEAETLNARLASVEAYVQNNLPYPPASLGLRLSLEKRASGEMYISATTAQPVNEPFVDVLVELTWNGGRILRAYTALLDPPTYAEQGPAPHAQAEAPEMRPAPEVAAEPPVQTRQGSEFQQEEHTAEAGAEPAPVEPGLIAPEPRVAQQPAEAGMPAAPREAAAPAAEEQYTVKRGDTLTKIATAHMSGDVTLEQLLVALFRSNQEAFSAKNMNRLKAGKVLQIPGSEQIAAVDVKEARREVHLQTVDFHAYRERLAAAAASGAATTAEAGQSAAGAVTGMVQGKGTPAPTEPKEVLKLSRGEEAGAVAAAQQRVRTLEEELAAREKTIHEQTERVTKLEKTVKDMQALLDIKSKGMSDLQKQAEPPPAMPAAPTTETHKATEAAPAPSITPATPATTETAAAPAAPPVAEPGPAAPKRPRVRVPPPPPEPTLADQLLDNPLYLAGGAAALGLLGFLGFRTARKRKETAYDESDVAEKKNLEVAPPLPATGTGTDTSGSVIAAARAAAPAQVTEEVDPLAEAEIYLAYGRDGQAEEILKEAAQNNPRRPEVHLKLLEIYAKRKDTAAFDTIARELHAATGGQGELWTQAARLGYGLDPQNPRYAAGKPSAAEAGVVAAAMASVSSLEEKLDFNIGLEDADTGTKTDIDLTRLGGAAGGTTTDIDLSNLGAPVAAAGIDLSTISSVPQRTLQIPNADVEPGAPATAETTAGGVDFDFDLSGVSGGPSAPQAPPQTSQILDKALMQTVADVGEPGMGAIEFDLSEMALDGGGPGKTEPTLNAAGSSAMPEIDLSGISLDLGGGQGDPVGTATVAAKDDHWYDVQTKFDLAKAYQEMGDKEGAREILQEVIAEGDAEQQAAAKRVLETLA